MEATSKIKTLLTEYFEKYPNKPPTEGSTHIKRSEGLKMLDSGLNSGSSSDLNSDSTTTLSVGSGDFVDSWGL